MTASTLGSTPVAPTRVRCAGILFSMPLRTDLVGHKSSLILATDFDEFGEAIATYKFTIVYHLTPTRSAEGSLLTNLHAL